LISGTEISVTDEMGKPAWGANDAGGSNKPGESRATDEVK
jgi:hypothetical protein